MADSSLSQPIAGTAAAHRRLFLRAAAIVAVSVMLSRVLGFFRDWTLAQQIGSNSVTDAYNAAFTIPDFLNYLLAGSALSITFMPVFLEYFSSERKQEAWHVFSIVLSFTCSLFAILLVVAEIYASTLTTWIAPGFSAAEQQMVTHLTRIMLPAQACFFIGGVLSSVQYAQGEFVIPSLAPLIYNGMIIAFGVALARRWGIESFSWGVLAGSLLGNCLVQIYGARKYGARFHFSLDLRHPGFRRFFRMTVPIMLGFSVIFVDDWAIRWFGSYLAASSISWLSYAKRLMLVVVALSGQAAGVAAYPILARLAAQQKFNEMRAHLEDALRHVVLGVVPISLLLALLSGPVVYILYSHTRMHPADIQQTAWALEIFLISASAWATQAIIARGFYALGDTLTPTLIGSGLLLLFIPIYRLLARHEGYLGLAVSSSLAITVYTAVLWIVLFRRLSISLRGITAYLLRAIAAAAVAGAAGLAVRHELAAYFAWQSLRGSLLDVVAVSFVFAAIFLPLASLLDLAAWRDLLANFSVRLKRRAEA